MVAKNMKGLDTMLRKELQEAMNTSSNRMFEDLKRETERFYDEGKPKVYVRTGALGETPRKTDVVLKNNTASFKAYLDTSHRYETGDKPSMLHVLRLANSGIPWVSTNGEPVGNTLGKKHFWEDSISAMKETFDNTMGEFFNNK